MGTWLSRYIWRLSETVVDDQQLEVKNTMVALDDRLRGIRLACAHARVERKTTMVDLGHEKCYWYIDVRCLDCGKSWTENPQ
jgi:hypothetical protein